MSPPALQKTARFKAKTFGGPENVAGHRGWLIRHVGRLFLEVLIHHSKGEAEYTTCEMKICDGASETVQGREHVVGKFSQSDTIREKNDRNIPCMAPPAEETATSIYAHESRGQKRTLHGGKRYIEPEASSECRRFFRFRGEV